MPVDGFEERTPGPWSVWADEGDHISVCATQTGNPTDHRECVASVKYRSDDLEGKKALANAKLIAAAPELLRQLAEQGEKLKAAEATWRCFHCGFETSNPAEAGAHFGERDDPEEFTPTCTWWAKLSSEERAQEFQDLRQQLNYEQRMAGDQVARIEGLEYRLEGQLSEIHSFAPFRKCDSIHQVFHVYDSMEGRALAAEAKRDEYREDWLGELGFVEKMEDLVAPQEAGRGSIGSSLESGIRALQAERDGLKARLAEVLQTPDTPEWVELVRMAYKEGGDGATRINRITAEHNRVRAQVKALEQRISGAKVCSHIYTRVALTSTTTCPACTNGIVWPEPAERIAAPKT